MWLIKAKTLLSLPKSKQLKVVFTEKPCFCCPPTFLLWCNLGHVSTTRHYFWTWVQVHFQTYPHFFSAFLFNLVVRKFCLPPLAVRAITQYWCQRLQHTFSCWTLLSIRNPTLPIRLLPLPALQPILNKKECHHRHRLKHSAIREIYVVAINLISTMCFPSARSWR